MVRIENKWFGGATSNGWLFHVTNKVALKDFIMGKIQLAKLFKVLVIRPEWLKDDGEGQPENWDFLLKFKEAYLTEIKEGRIKPNKLEGRFIEKAWDFFLSIYRGDSAYFERIGGTLMFLMLNDKEWKEGHKSHLNYLKATKLWWLTQDMRPRARDLLSHIFDFFIEKYESKDKFYVDSTDFCIQWLIDHKTEFKMHQFYDPTWWYPRGKGQVNWSIHAGES